MVLSHLAGVKACANTLKCEAILRADNNDPAAAESVQAGLALAHSLKNEPTLISQLVRIAVDYLTCAGLERCVNRVKFCDEQLAALGSSLHEADDTIVMSRALAGERATSIKNFRASAKVQEAGNSSPDSTDEPLDMGQFQNHLSLLRWTGIFERDLQFWLTSMETNITVAARPAPDRLAMSNLVNTQSLKARKNFNIMSGLLLLALAKATVRPLMTGPGCAWRKRRGTSNIQRPTSKSSPAVAPVIGRWTLNVGCSMFWNFPAQFNATPRRM